MDFDKVDVIVFGATGFTGEHVVEECAKAKNFSWAVAGRDENKLRELLEKVSSDVGIDVTKKPILVANCNCPESVSEMVIRGRVVINCTGPFRFYGECVVKACIENGTHYVDVTGEPEFMERMQLNYHELAETNGCYIVNACGMDSVPVDIGVLHFCKHFDGPVNYVETYMKISTLSDKYEPILNYTTWESAVLSFANQQSLVELRKKLFLKMKTSKFQPPIPRKPTVHPSPLFNNKPSLSFPGSDRSVVVRSQMFLANKYDLRPIQCNVYLVCESKVVLWALLLVGYFLQLLTQYSWGQKLLLKFPRMFSMGMVGVGDSVKSASRNTITSFKFYGEGWSKDALHKSSDDAKTITVPPDSSMVTMLQVQNAAYGFTSICVIQCALLIINETNKLPSTGGVYTPAAAFHNTSIIETLAKHGFEFKVVKKNKK